MTKQCSAPEKVLLDLLSNAWTLEILRALEARGTLRFGLIKDAVEGISGRVLAVRLKRMEELGFVVRYSHPTSPPQVDYTLTAKGLELIEFLALIEQRAVSWVPASA